jgi:hypothetical protein
MRFDTKNGAKGLITKALIRGVHIQGPWFLACFIKALWTKHRIFWIPIFLHSNALHKFLNHVKRVF